ncbi:TetR family transcriptional regulator [Streptomyces capillispiralis]|nr:TetR family transcriptional regulator [Streptomyces capillispiralis]
MGWNAVTTRRLSDHIEYSQPVLYKHFKGKEDIVRAVALEGFGEMADALQKARVGADTPRERFAAAARCYTEFASVNRTLYEAMFMLNTDLTFGGPDSPENLIRCFEELKSSVLDVAGPRDPETFTEVVWASLHGLVTLERAGRLRASHQEERLAMFVQQHFEPQPDDPRG